MSRPIHTSRLVPHPGNIRGDLGDLAELTASIKAQGILQPLVVEPRPDGKYTVLAGHRRLAAAKRARVDMVPVVIRQAAGSEAKAIEIMLVENCQRRDLGPIEKAEAMGKLRDRGYTQTAIARAIGLHVSMVSTYLAYLDLDPESRERVRSGAVRGRDAIKAVRNARQARSSGPRQGRPVQIQAPWFTDRHPLAQAARAMCGHTRRPVVGNVACGQCWEQAIRDDAAGPDPGEEADCPSPRQERLELIAGLRFHEGSEEVPPPGYVTAAQAAEQIGVSQRTIERYKRDLRAMAGAS